MANTKQENNMMKVKIGFPEHVDVELVPASEIKHYEIFTHSLSLFLASASGFWTSFFTTPNNRILLIVSIVFSFFTILSLAMVIYYRKKIVNGKVTKVIEIKDLK